MYRKNTNCPDWLIYAYKSGLISETRLDEIWLRLTKIWAAYVLKLDFFENKNFSFSYGHMPEHRLTYPPSFDLTLLH